MDTLTKRADYERAGVGEYWIIEPQRKSVTFLRWVDGIFVEAPAEADAFHSTVIPGFALDLKLIREAFKPG